MTNPFENATNADGYYEATIIAIRDDVILVRDIYNEVRGIDPKLVKDAKVGIVLDLHFYPSVPTNQLSSILGG